MEAAEAIKFYSLGDSALLVEWGNTISRGVSQQVNLLAKTVAERRFTGLVDVVPAYASLTVLYNPVTVQKHAGLTAFEHVRQQVKALLEKMPEAVEEACSLITIPVCYHESLGNDLLLVSKQLGISKETIIALHLANEYYIYMQGFVPGFAYLGEVDERLNMPRKSEPVPTKAGAVGIAGQQTGIYPVNSPGGWHILGHTPIKLFDVKKQSPCLLQPGNMVRFKLIGLEEYHSLKNHQMP